jgi:hypothetical protein
MKWVRLLRSLEIHHGLDPEVPGHIWIVHHLFLPAINLELLAWAEAWNCHSLRIRGERQRSPQDMFFFGVIQNGARGLAFIESPMANLDEYIGSVEEYGIDWAELERARNIPVDHPEHMAAVVVDPPNCPLTAEEMVELDSSLPPVPVLGRMTEADKRMRWIAGLQRTLATVRHDS